MLGVCGRTFRRYVDRHEDDERAVGNDHCVAFERLTLQRPSDRHRYHSVKAKVRVHRYADGTLGVFHGPRRLATPDAKGVCQRAETEHAVPRRESTPLTRPVLKTKKQGVLAVGRLQENGSFEFQVGNSGQAPLIMSSTNVPMGDRALIFSDRPDWLSVY